MFFKNKIKQNKKNAKRLHIKKHKNDIFNYAIDILMFQ